MSAEPYDADPEAMPQAQPAVDILPVQASRKARHPEPEAVQPAPVDPAWAGPAGPVNPWTGAPDPVAQAAPAVAQWPAPPVAQPAPAQPAPEQPTVPELPVAQPTVPEHPVAHQPEVGDDTVVAGPAVPMHANSIPPSIPVPVFPGAGVPAAEPVGVDSAPTVGDPDQPTAKRFLGMQLRRPRRADGSLADDSDVTSLGPPVPVAAWPTDVGLPVVAHAEPATPAPWGPLLGNSGSDDGHEGPADTVPAQAPEAYSWENQSLADTPVEAAPVEPVAVEPVAVEPVAEPVAPVAIAEPVATPAPVPSADDAEVRSLRTLVDASEARRGAAEQRADHAVAYAQQLQAELTRVQSDLEAKLQASEVRVRTAANEAQDWQIRHREAQTQITELAASLAGAEQRLADVRAERDELMVQLEEATSPRLDTVAQQLEG